jgi:hypothetical protein
MKGDLMTTLGHLADAVPLFEDRTNIGNAKVHLTRSTYFDIHLLTTS